MILILCAISIFVIKTYGADIFLNKAKKAYELSGIKDEIEDEKSGPVIVIHEPFDYQKVTNDIWIKAAITDNYKIKEAAYKINNNALMYIDEPVDSTFTVWNIRFIYNTIYTANGTNTIYLYAYDEAGNKTETSVRINVDNNCVWISLFSPGTNTLYNTSTISVVGEADSNVELNSVMVRLNTGEWKPAFGTYQWFYSFNNIPDGTNTISVYAIDNNRKSSTTNHVTFRVDATPPVLNVISPTNNAIFTNSTVIVKGTCIDAFTGVREVLVSTSTNNTNSNTWNTNREAVSWSNIYTTMPSGTNYIFIRAEDNAFNKSDVLMILVIIQ